MATTKQAAPAKKSEGFQGVRGAFWIIVVCAIIRDAPCGFGRGGVRGRCQSG